MHTGKMGAKATVKRRVWGQVLPAETVHHWLECHMRKWKENLGGGALIDGDSIRKDQKVFKQNEVIPLAANMDRPGDDRTKWKKSDRGRQII